MHLDYFTRLADYMLAQYRQDPDDIEWNDVLAWLLDAPEHAPNAALDVWTQWIRIGVAGVNEEFSHRPEFGHMLYGYFNRLLSIPDDSFVQLSLSPDFLSGLRILQQRAHGVHPAVAAMLQLGWEPAPLMARFEALRQETAKAHYEKHKYPMELAQTGGATFLMMMHPLMHEGSWRPKPHPAYAGMFDTYVLSSSAAEGPDSRFIRNTLAAAPSQLHKALSFLRTMEMAQPVHLQALFPLPLLPDNAGPMLDALVALAVDEPNGIKGMVLPLLRQYHPQLAELVGMHCSLFTDARPGQTHAQFLVEPYLHILAANQGIPKEHYAVDSSMFEQFVS